MPGVALGLTHRVIDVEVGQLVATEQQRRGSGQVDPRPGRDRNELADMTERDRHSHLPRLEGVRTPVDDRRIPSWRRNAMSSMEAAPATIPATSDETFRGALHPLGRAIRTCPATGSRRPVRSAGRRTGVKRAHDTRLGSSNFAAGP